MDFQKLITDFFQLPPTLTEYIVAAVIVAAFLYQLYYYIRYMAGINRRLRRLRKGKIVIPVQQPPVSVIVCARNEEDNLRNFLPQLLAQDYPEYEVIVVDDSSEDQTRTYVHQLSNTDPHLRFTFVPKGSYQFSTKKLAITLGVKAAKYEHLLFTDADCRPSGPHWISTMMKGFTSGKEIVLGFGAYEKVNSHLNRLIAYDTLWNGMQYLGQAASGHPYMGVGRNMAYTKSLFIRNKGFAKYLHIIAGDDDLFINQVATRKNTNIEVEPEALTWSIPKESFSEWWNQKRRHIGVSPNYRFASKVRLLFEPLSRLFFYGGIIAAGFLCRPYIWACALVLLLIRFIWQLSIINVTAKKLGQTRFHINLLWFDIVLPLVDLILLFASKFSKKKRYVW